MEEGEAKIRQEDCNEDNLGQGVLTLTNKRVAFDKTRGRIMDFAKKFGDTVLDVQLDSYNKGCYCCLCTIYLEYDICVR